MVKKKEVGPRKPRVTQSEYLNVFCPPAMKDLHRHAKGLYAALGELYKSRKTSRLLFPPGFEPNVVLDQIALLGDRPKKKGKAGRKKEHTDESKLSWLRQVEALKKKRRCIDKVAIMEIIEFEWHLQSTEEISPEELLREYARRRAGHH